MMITPTQTGGRVVQGDTAFGEFRFETDAQNNLIAWMMRKSDPPGTAIAKALKRAGVKPCGGCERRRDWLDRQWWRFVCAWRCLKR